MTNLIPFIRYTDEDDRCHKLPAVDYYEWWYSDFRFTNGWTAVAVWHYRDWLKKPRVPSVEISIYDPDGNRYYEETVVDTRGASASETICDVKIGKHHFRQGGNQYRLLVDSRKAGADLVMKCIAPPFFIAPGAIYSEGGDEHFWCVPVPRGEAEGSLYVNGEEMKVKGICYHDHNWGSCDMNRSFGGWTWGRFFDKTYSGIFSCSFPVHVTPSSEPQLNSHSGILYVAKGSELVLCTEKIELVTKEESFDELTGQIIGTKLLLSGREDGSAATCEFTIQRVVERDHLKFSGWNSHNWRFLDSYDAEIAVDGKKESVSGQMLHEKFLLRLK
jgi:hypothetical protein